MTIIEQLESWLDCDEETQVDGDGIFNGVGATTLSFLGTKNGTLFSSYFYDPYTGELRLYDVDDHSKCTHRFQCNLDARLTPLELTK